MTKYYICQNPHCGCWVMVDTSKPVIKRMGGPLFCPICGMKTQQKETTVCTDYEEKSNYTPHWLYKFQIGQRNK